jgi:hypothetical protein
MGVKMFQLRALSLYFMITTIVGERLGARSIEFNEMRNENILYDTNGQKLVQEETHLNDWRLLQLDGVAVLDVTVRTPLTGRYPGVCIETQKFNHGTRIILA